MPIPLPIMTWNQTTLQSFPTGSSAETILGKIKAAVDSATYWKVFSGNGTTDDYLEIGPDPNATGAVSDVSNMRIVFAGSSSSEPGFQADWRPSSTSHYNGTVYHGRIWGNFCADITGRTGSSSSWKNGKLTLTGGATWDCGTNSRSWATGGSVGDALNELQPGDRVMASYSSNSYATNARWAVESVTNSDAFIVKRPADIAFGNRTVYRERDEVFTGSLRIPTGFAPVGIGYSSFDGVYLIESSEVIAVVFLAGTGTSSVYPFIAGAMIEPFASGSGLDSSDRIFACEWRGSSGYSDLPENCVTTTSSQEQVFGGYNGTAATNGQAMFRVQSPDASRVPSLEGEWVRAGLVHRLEGAYFSGEAQQPVSARDHLGNIVLLRLAVSFKPDRLYNTINPNDQYMLGYLRQIYPLFNSEKNMVVLQNSSSEDIGYCLGHSNTVDGECWGFLSS